MASKKNYYNELVKKIKGKKTKVAIIGIGYVGIKLALAFAKAKVKVFCYDQDVKKINLISKGESPYSYISDNKIKKVIKYLNLRNSLHEISEVDVIIFCLPTPLNKNKPDISDLRNGWSKVKPFIRTGQLIVLESTTYPGCTEEIFGFDLKKKFELDNNIFLSYSPERENPGDKKYDFRNTPKVVSGVGKKSLHLCNLLYKIITHKTILSPSIKLAEMSKLLENIYRSVNIALINELRIATLNLNIDLYKVIKIASTKPFGFQKFFPGPGTGGHCIPVDPTYFSWLSKKNGFAVKFIELSSKINKFRTNWIVSKIKKIVGNSKNPNSKILILGLSYKKNIEDTRESASVKILEKLKESKYKIDFCDPFVIEKNFLIKNTKILIKSKKYSKKLFDNYKYIILATDHDCYNYSFIRKTKKVIFDLRGKYQNISDNNIYQL
jgi:UDP-N-acetyl-D-glucosamine dehydrogenase